MPRSPLLLGSAPVAPSIGCLLLMPEPCQIWDAVGFVQLRDMLTPPIVFTLRSDTMSRHELAMQNGPTTLQFDDF